MMMLDIHDFLLSAGTVLAETCLIYLFIGFHFKMRGLPKPKFVAVFVGSWLLQLAKYFFHNRYSPYLPFYSMVIDFTAICVCFNGKVRFKALLMLLYYGIIICCEALVFSIIMTFTPYAVQTLHSEGIRELIVFVLSKALQCVVVIIMAKYGWIKNRLVLNKGVVVLFLVVPVAGALSIYVLYPAVWLAASTQMLLIMILFSLFILTFIFVLFYFLVMQAKTDEKLETAQLSEQNALSYLNDINLTQKGLRKLMHDFRYNLLHLKHLLDQHETKEAREFIQSIDEALISNIPLHIIGNAQIDSLIQYYKSQCSNEGIDFKIYGKLPADIRILYSDMTRLLGNALDNAIESCKNCDGPFKSIKIEFTYDNGFLSIRVTNPYRGRIKEIGGRLITTKNNTNEHGYGMAIMEEIAEKYNGGIFYKIMEDMFVLRIALYEKDN